MKTIALYFTLLFSVILIAQNNSLQFDGFDDKVALYQNFAFEVGDTFTIESWVYLEEKESYYKQIISKLNDNDGFLGGWGFLIQEGNFLTGVVSEGFTSNSRYVVSIQSLDNNVWYHVAMVFDAGQTVSLFINGELAPSNEYNSGILSTIAVNSPTQIGSSSIASLEDFFKGNIDELRIWGSVRTPAEIESNYNTELSGAETDLIGYYKMDINNSTCDVQDCSVSQIHGQRIGSNGANDLPQFSENTPAIVDVACGSVATCELNVGANAVVDFSIFPNPTSTSISFTGIDVANLKIKIYNVQGMLVQEKEILNNNMDVFNLSKGVYFISLTLGNKQVTKIFIKN